VGGEGGGDSQGCRPSAETTGLIPLFPPLVKGEEGGFVGHDKKEGVQMPKKILIVDDDPDLVEAVTMILESKNYDVAAAYGGIEGLQKAKTEKPDLIVLDVMMPDKDGYAVCKELKADPKLSKIPILLLTAVVSKIATTRYTQQMGLETEADDYIDKPVEPEVLVKRIETLLAK
jgi:two-component system alkaline phosphatase synthesis response regulator PhoP